jgi:lycopene cyclase domain-containing protein
VPEYTIAVLVGVGAVVVYECARAHSGIFRSRTYWLTIAIVVGFQCLVDGWLTRLDDPIVRYDAAQITGVRVLWGIPVEDFLFGFALLTWVLIRWRLRDRSSMNETSVRSGSMRPSASGAPRG